MSREPIPLARRPGDIAILAFFLLNILFITYFVDLEQLVIADPTHFTYPIWPPAPGVDLIHWYARNFDPLILARPVWWKMTIWIDDLFFGPFYIIALFAYSKGKEWIRIPSIIYASVMLTNVTIILGEEYAGPHAAPSFLMVVLENLLWILLPVYILYRMWRYPQPFTRPVAEAFPEAQPESTQPGTVGAAS